MAAGQRVIFLRSLLFNLVYLPLTAVFSIAGTAYARTPARALALGRAWARTSLLLLRVMCGVRFEVSGRARVAGGGAMLIASQHQSAFDTMVWFLLAPRVAYVVKRELADAPLFGRLAMRAGMIRVDRGGGGAALRALLRGSDAAVAAGRQIVIFPEGTRADPARPAPLQAGVAAIASRTGLDVIPVRTNSGQFWPRRGFLKRPGVIRLEIGPPLPPGPREQVMAALAAAFGGQAVA